MIIKDNQEYVFCLIGLYLYYYPKNSIRSCYVSLTRTIMTVERFYQGIAKKTLSLVSVSHD